MKIICNTTPFIALASIGQVDLLQKIYTSIEVPEAVVKEINEGGKIYVPDISNFEWVDVLRNIRNQDDRLLFQLDNGERQVILNALNQNADLVLIDDLIARKIADYLGLKVKGTLGVLVEGKRRGMIPSFKDYAFRMKEQGIRFSDRLILEIAKELDE